MIFDGIPISAVVAIAIAVCLVLWLALSLIRRGIIEKRQRRDTRKCHEAQEQEERERFAQRVKDNVETDCPNPTCTERLTFYHPKEWNPYVESNMKYLCNVCGAQFYDLVTKGEWRFSYWRDKREKECCGTCIHSPEDKRCLYSPLRPVKDEFDICKQFKWEPSEVSRPKYFRDVDDG